MKRYLIKFKWLIAPIFLVAIAASTSANNNLLDFKKDSQSSVSGQKYTWFNGNRQESVWLSNDEAAVFLKKKSNVTKSEKEEIKDLFDRTADFTSTNNFVYFLISDVKSAPKVIDRKLSKVEKANDVKIASPVFYPSGNKNPEAKMALTGEIIIHFKSDWSKQRIDQWVNKHDLSIVKDFDFSKNTYLFTVGDALKSLRLANEIYRSKEVIYAYPNWLKTRAKKFIPDDPLFPDQWHLRNIGQVGGSAGADVNITSIWDTYKGSVNEVIAVVDDGLEITHEDLAPNVLAGYSYDYVDYPNDTDPSPGAGDDHGTSVGGVAAARGDNNKGVSGAAPQANLVGHRLLGASTDANEADALSRNKNVIDIYSNSWGPPDGYGMLAGPEPLAAAAITSGAATGRGGKGSIYVWAGGNGYDDGSVRKENSNYDGYANSRFVIGVGATDNYAERSLYSESGANILVNAPSDGGSLGITTTDRTGNDGDSVTSYTNTFGGTSSATPLVSGVVALMLQANSNLGYRDVQQILATSAYKNDPTDPDWVNNAAGYHVNHSYGFGRVDAQAAVSKSLTWTNVGPELSTEKTISPNTPIPDANPNGVSNSIFINDNLRVEHVEVYLTAPHQYWGDLKVELTAPSGTKSILAETHLADPAYGYYNWRFGSVRHLGEASPGNWTLKVIDGDQLAIGNFQTWRIKIYGTYLGAPVYPPSPPAPVVSPPPAPALAPAPAPTPKPKKKKKVVTAFHKKKCKNKKYHASHCKSVKNKKQTKKNKKFHSKKCSKIIIIK